MKAKPRIRVSGASRVSQPEPFPVVGVGASAGGLEAFTELLRHLPEKTGMAFVLVQHLDPHHPSGLPGILARTTKLPVMEVTDGTVVQPNQVYVIPPDTSMSMKEGTLRLTARTPTRGQYLPIDYLFSSLAEELGSLAIAAVLSGTASDGTQGCRAIKAAGGITFAQDEKSAKYPSMPAHAAAAGCIDFVLPPAEIATELARVKKRHYLAPRSAKETDLTAAPGDQMKKLVALLNDATGVDFTYYKQSTLHRRIMRRMVLHKIEKLKNYVSYVGRTPNEVEQLYQDLLIHVTGFFRDPDAFAALWKHVFPGLFQDNKRGGTIRIWVPGCSTGEEVYSLAMIALEYLWLETQKTAKPPLGSMPFQIFATDISEGSLDRARAGLYSEALVGGVSPQRLRRFFVPIDGGYQIVKPVREMCIFAKQNLAKDPPFSNLDLISCRNLLIYMGPVLQSRVVPTLHYALKPNGYLLLGGAESLGSFAEYFVAVDKKNRIYQKKRSAVRPPTYFGSLDFGVRTSGGAKPVREESPAFTIEKEVDRLMAQRFVPASIVVNADLDIVQFRGKTGPYLEPASGHPTFSLSRMVREGMLIDVRAALSKARKENTAVRKEGVHIQSNGGTREISLEVIPLRGHGPKERYYVVVFGDAPKKPAVRQESPMPAATASREAAQLKRELARLREQFQSLIEEHETTNEEFKAANEEVLSANEELQSANEELETAKEELQSSNEELTTLNEELQNRNAELTAVNNDLLNLLANVTLPVVMVDSDLHIRRFSPPAQKLLNLLPGDVGRRLTEIRPNVDAEDLGALARESMASVSTQEREVQESETGVWYQLRVRPYRTWDNKIDGAVISFQDIDAIKRSLELSRAFADTAIENAREAILILDGQLRVTSANPYFCRNFGVSRKATEGHAIYELCNGQWDIPQLRLLLEHVLPNNARVEDFEVRHKFPQLGPRVMMLNARRIEPQPGRQLILLYIEDVTTAA